MPTITWLHFTDFHQGMGDQPWIWPNVRARLFEDLKAQHDRSGPWDLVLFTGDLAQRGEATEYEQLDENLDLLWAQFDKLGSNPSLVVVPGNHDLQRPEQKSPVLKAFRTWHTDPEIGEEFWTVPTSPYRRLIDETFAAFTAWWQKCKYNNLPHNSGLLPGEFSCTFEKDALRLGLVGLNSAFFHLTSHNYEGELIVSARQFHAACKADGPTWLASHHANVLLTHHPISWLHKTIQKEFRGEIDFPGNFIVHLCGHVHEPESIAASIGGSGARNCIHGASLCGLEKVFVAGSESIDRFHGYSVQRLQMDHSGGSLTVWPRMLTKHKGGGHWRMVADTERFDLKNDAFSFPINAKMPLTPRESVDPGGSKGRLSTNNELRPTLAIIVPGYGDTSRELRGIFESSRLWRNIPIIDEDPIRIPHAYQWQADRERDLRPVFLIHFDSQYDANTYLEMIRQVRSRGRSFNYKPIFAVVGDATKFETILRPDEKIALRRYFRLSINAADIDALLLKCEKEWLWSPRSGPGSL